MYEDQCGEYKCWYYGWLSHYPSQCCNLTSTRLLMRGRVYSVNWAIDTLKIKWKEIKQEPAKIRILITRPTKITFPQITKQKKSFPVLETPSLNNDIHIVALIVHCIRIELESDGFCGEGKTGVPGEKPLRSRVENQQTQPTYDADWWEASALTTAPSLLSLIGSPSQRFPILIVSNEVW